MRKIIILLTVLIGISIIASNGFGANIITSGNTISKSTGSLQSVTSEQSTPKTSTYDGGSGKGPLGNGPPVAEIVSIDPNPSYISTQVNFHGRGFDPENCTKYFSWDFNSDGIWEVLNDPVGGSDWVDHYASYTYSSPGTFVVTLRVKDVVGDYDTKYQNEVVIKSCDLSIQATYSPDPIIQDDYIYFNIVISDQLGNYNGQVQVLTTSDIPIDLTNYFNWNTENNSASGSVSFIWPKSDSNYYVHILVVPLGTFFDMDVSDNMVSFDNLIGKTVSVGSNLLSGVSVQSQSLLQFKTQLFTFGSSSLFSFLSESAFYSIANQYLNSF